MVYKRIFEVKYLRKVYGFARSSVVAVDDVSFDVLNGEFLGIMGASGSGKTTLLNMLASITMPSHGEIIFDGENIKNFPRNRLTSFRGNEISYIFQDFKLIDNLTAYENIVMPLKIHNKNIDSVYIKNLARDLSISDLLDKFPHELSGGEKQRVAALRAIAIQPKVILADEPTGALDSLNSTDLLNILQSLNKDLKTTIIMVTHDSYAASFCERILFLKDGKIINELAKFENEPVKDYHKRISQASRQLIR